MASFGPQVKNMAQVTAGGKGEKDFAGGVHRSEYSVSKAQSLPHPLLREGIFLCSPTDPQRLSPTPVYSHSLAPGPLHVRPSVRTVSRSSDNALRRLAAPRP